MGAERPPRIVLTGFSFTGKSLVARLVAQRLDWRALDIDDQVVAEAGRSIPDIFAQEGEPAFRERERGVLAQACREERVVIATGGGAVLDLQNRRLMARGGFVVCLEARPETILARLQAHQRREPGSRPLLAGPDPSTASGQALLARIRQLKAQRQPLYALADHTVHTDSLSPEEVADEVVRAWQALSPQVSGDGERLSAEAGTGEELFAGAAYVVRTETQRYPLFVGWGALADLGRRMRQMGLGGRSFVVSDEVVGRLHGRRAQDALAAAGYESALLKVPVGEASKSLAMASRVYDWLLGHRAERGDVVVALGGGVVGDLAGFVAATFLRGVPLVQVPTSLLAMVDASIGGKVAVNHPKAKNIIGAFYQPRLVLADASLLQTLPQRELTAGWAEVIKHALIMDEGLLEGLAAQAEAVTSLEPTAVTPVIARSMALKGQVVSQDEKETGLRTILNYGHTIGHALEAAAAYRGILHGEAVAVGMMGAAQISHRLGLLPKEAVERQRRIFLRFGLPLTMPAVERAPVLAAMALDKKVRQQAIRWVLLEGIGRPVIRDDVPAELVEDVLRDLLGG